MNTTSSSPTPSAPGKEEEAWYPDGKPSPTPKFARGEIAPTYEVSVVIPSGILLEAIEKHCQTTPSSHAAPVRTEHRYSGRVFFIETSADRERTTIAIK